MLDRIIAFSLRNRILVLATALAIAIVGTITAENLPIDVLPDLNRPTVTVLAEAHEYSPEDVERYITHYIEQAVNGATGVTRVRSSSGMGLSVVWVEFDWNTDIYRNRQIVQEKLQLARAHLPEGITPHMAPISSIMGQIMHVGVRSRSGTTSPTEIRALADQLVKLRLLSVSGVAQVVSTGGAPPQLQVTVDAEKLQAHGVTLQEVEAAIQNGNLSGAGGFLTLGNEGPLVSVMGLVQQERELATAVIRDDDVRPVLLQDVAEVKFGPAAVRTGTAGIDAGPGVILTVQMQPVVDTVELTERVEAELAEIQQTLPEDLEIMPGLYRQADFIERAVENVGHAVRDGAILVLIVLAVFLLNFRTTIITLTAIPLSIAVTALIFWMAGISINTMTLGGLAVAIGALVDDAIVDVENVFRRLKQNNQTQRPRSALAVVFMASSEVRGPILIGTIVVAAVYIPLFALSGMEGKLFAPIGVAYIVSILASLVVALTVTPVLCSYLLPNFKGLEKPQDGLVVRGLKDVAGRLIAFSVRYPKQIAVLLMALVISGGALMITRGSEFLPPFNEGSALVNLALPPGTNLETSDAFGRRLEKLIADVEGIQHFSRQTGRAEGDEHAHGVNFSAVLLSVDPDSGRSREEVLEDIRERVEEEFPGVPTSTEQPLAHLMSHMLSGVNAQVAIKIFGPDLVELRSIAAEVKGALEPIPGVADLIKEPQVLVKRVEVKPRRQDLARHGLTVHDIRETVELALEGEVVSRMNVGQYFYPIVVRLEAEDRKSLGSVENLLLHTSTGARLRLGDVADVQIGLTSNNVNRENVSRRIVVQHNVQGRSLGEVVSDVDRVLEPIRAELPAGYSIQISGQFEAQEKATRVILWLSLLSLLVMFFVLFMHFRSVNLALQTLASIPMAFIGAVAFLLVTNQTMSVATLVGFVSLAGIAARNQILLIDHYLFLMREEGMPFGTDMLIRAGRERIVPVLMTALTSGVALIPLVLAPGQPGRELLYPVASVIVGGLLSSTLLDVLLTPGVFLLFGRGAVHTDEARYDPSRLVSAKIALTFDPVDETQPDT